MDHSQSEGNTKGLSSKELKAKLIQVVKNKGIYDSMKSQLRNKLVLELNPNNDLIKNKNSNQTSVNMSKSNLALTTVNCLLINHLKSNEYDYSLSVFMPECGIGLNEAYSLTDVLNILKISPESKLYNDLLNSTQIKTRGLLWYLVNYFCSHYVTHETSTQTDFDGIHNISSTLDHKLKTLDKHYLELSENFSGKLSFEEKIIAYQTKLDEKSKSELEKKLNEFKEIELARMRIEEREKLRLELQSYRLELEHKFQKRNEDLKQKESSLDSVLNHKRELEEREIFLQRQHLLDEMKQLRDKEAEMKKSFEFQLKLIGSDSSKYEILDEKLKKREADLRAAEMDLDNKLRSERERIKIELERSYAQREFILESIENKNKQDSVHNSIERAQLDRIKHEHQVQQARLNEISLELDRARGEAMCFKQENELMKEKLSHCMDYDFILQENKMLKYKLEISKELIGEKSLTRRTPRLPEFPENNPAAVDYVPRRKRSVTFASEGGGDNNQIPLLDLNNDLATERSADPFFNDETSRKLTYREEGDKILSETVENIEQSVNNGLVNSELKDLYEMQIYEQRKLQETINDVKKNVEFLFNGISAPNDDSKSKQDDLVGFDFVSSAKDRYKFLETENERIEQTYRDYQHKIKSKYYPINDSEDDQIKIITTHKKKDYDFGELEKFLEMTAKASIHSKIMREEIETEMHNYEARKENELNNANTLRSLENVETLIKNVSLPSLVKTEEKSNKNLKKSYLDDDTSISSIVKETDKERVASFRNKYLDEDKTFSSGQKFDHSESNKEDTTSIKKFGLSDYKNLFDKTDDRLDKVEEKQVAKEITPPRKIQIVYSSSSSSSSPLGHSSEENTVSINKDKFSKVTKKNEYADDDDDDEDFKW